MYCVHEPHQRNESIPIMAGIKLRGFTGKRQNRRAVILRCIEGITVISPDNNRKGLVTNRKRIIDGLDAYRRVFGCKRPSGLFITNIEAMCKAEQILIIVKTAFY